MKDQHDDYAYFNGWVTFSKISTQVFVIFVGQVFVIPRMKGHRSTLTYRT